MGNQNDVEMLAAYIEINETHDRTLLEVVRLKDANKQLVAKIREISKQLEDFKNMTNGSMLAMISRLDEIVGKAVAFDMIMRAKDTNVPDPPLQSTTSGGEEDDDEEEEEDEDDDRSEVDLGEITMQEDGEGEVTPSAGFYNFVKLLQQRYYKVYTALTNNDTIGLDTVPKVTSF